MKFDIPDNWLVYLSALDLMRDEKKIATTTTATATTATTTTACISLAMFTVRTRQCQGLTNVKLKTLKKNNLYFLS